MRLETLKHKHRWIYFYVRGRKDRFNYPFPIWLSARKCKGCLEMEILQPFNYNLNSGKAEWMKEKLDLKTLRIESFADSVSWRTFYEAR
jgi:hypothetical protein